VRDFCQACGTAMLLRSQQGIIREEQST
jgi:hypothetical protein